VVSVKLLNRRCYLVVFLRKNNDNNDKHDDSTGDNHNIDNSHSIDDSVDNHSDLYHSRGNHGNHRHDDGHNHPGFS
jgi:hypothetical protein